MDSASVQRAQLFHFLQLQRGFHHAQDAQAQLVLGLHGGDNIFLDRFGKAHGNSPLPNYNRHIYPTFTILLDAAIDTRRAAQYFD